MDKKIQVLLLEDEQKLLQEIKARLEMYNMACDVVYDGELFLKLYDRNHYDIFILDINVPKINGLEVCKVVRAKNSRTPILMLTAFGEVGDKVEALQIGADDYLVKPFHFDELIARIQSLVRRSAKSSENNADETISIGDLVINTNTTEVFRAGNSINLTPKEFKLLVVLASANGRPVSKQTLSEKVWNHFFETGTNTLEVYINFLRNKIDKNYPVKLIHTKAGYGYYLRED